MLIESHSGGVTKFFWLFLWDANNLIDRAEFHETFMLKRNRNELAQNFSALRFKRDSFYRVLKSVYFH